MRTCAEAPCAVPAADREQSPQTQPDRSRTCSNIAGENASHALVTPPANTYIGRLSALTALAITIPSARPTRTRNFLRAFVPLDSKVVHRSRRSAIHACLFRHPYHRFGGRILLQASAIAAAARHPVGSTVVCPKLASHRRSCHAKSAGPAQSRRPRLCPASGWPYRPRRAPRPANFLRAQPRSRRFSRITRVPSPLLNLRLHRRSAPARHIRGLAQHAGFHINNSRHANPNSLERFATFIFGSKLIDGPRTCRR